MIAAGEFSYVCFFHTVEGFRTFTYRNHRTDGKGAVLPLHYGGNNADFNKVFVCTSLLRKV